MHRTQSKIAAATIKQIEDHGLTVTTKQIAETAGVNELTLFRHFGSKQRLIVSAIGQLLSPIVDTRFTPSGNLCADLTLVAEHYAQFADAHPGVLVQLLSTTDPQLIKTVVLPLQQQIGSSLTELMEFYQQRGELASIACEDLIREFMGPLLARAFLHRTLAVHPLPARDYTLRFVRGHAGTSI
jgi:AcrR family transcriptional regulator